MRGSVRLEDLDNFKFGTESELTSVSRGLVPAQAGKASFLILHDASGSARG